MKSTGLQFIATVFLALFIHKASSKTEDGVINSLKAAKSWGQFITEFCFTGTGGGLYYKLNDTTPAGILYFYSQQSWAEAGTALDCKHKLMKAEYTVNIVQKGGNHSSLLLSHGGLWRVVYGDTFTCSPVLPEENPVYIHYDVRLFNTDYHGQPRSHFECQDRGLLTYFEALAFIYFVVGCICSPKIYETLKKGGPMHEVMSMLTSVMAFQVLGTFSMLLHLYRYSLDGLGSSLMENMAELLDIIAQFIMLYMMVSLSLGWTLSSTKTQVNAQVWKTSPLAKVAAGITAILCFLTLMEQLIFTHHTAYHSHQSLLWMVTILCRISLAMLFAHNFHKCFLTLMEQLVFTQHSAYHSHQSLLGVVTILCRISLAMLFAHNLHKVVSKEKSIVRREFYSNFAKLSFTWFFAYPVLILMSLLLSHYVRKRFLMMTVTSVQAAVVVLLYRLFLSRSLYWEISSLSSSSSLPLRLEKNFSLKNYSS